MRRGWLIAPLFAALAAMSESPLSPDEARAAWRLADPQLRIELVAAEPDVLDPVAMAFDENGRIYVVEMNDYPLGPPGGHIKLLDTDEQGRVVKSVVFADHIPYPTGICCWKGGVFVTAAPDILYLKDTDGDGRADVREVVYTGFTTGNQQHRINNPTFAFDGWIYGGNGASGGSVRRVIGGEKTGTGVSINGMDWRFRPDLSAFESVSGQSQFAQTFDAWGNRFVNENWTHIRHAVLHSRYLKKNPYLALPTVLEEISDHGATAQVFPASKILPRFNDPQTAGHFTSACAVTIYGGDALPAKYRGKAFCCEPVHDLVHLDLLEPSGATFIARRAWPDKEFLASTDNWCRPVNLANAPDGALYVVDMYRQVIEHPEWIYNRADTQLTADELKKVDLRAGDQQGRIWRVVPKDFRVARKPHLSDATTRQLVSELSNPNGWWRITAQRLLIERQPKDAIKPLRDMARTSKTPLARFHALYTLDALNALDDETLRAALRDAEPRIREHALRLCEKDHGALVLAAAETLAEDADFRVRWQLALSLSQIQPPADANIARALSRIARRNRDDKWMRFAVLSASSQNSLQLLTAVQSDLAWVHQLAALIGAKKDRVEVNELLARIADATPAGWQTEALAGLGEGLRRSGARLEDFKITERLNEFFIKACETAVATNHPEAQRVEAIRLLAHAQFASVLPPLTSFLQPQQPQALQLAAIQSLAAHTDDEVATILLARWRSFSPQTRAAALDALLLRPDRVAKLLDAIERGDVGAGELDAPHRSQLLRHPNKSLAQRAQKILAAETQTDRAKIIEEFRPALALRGDVTRGQQIYAKTCVQCHRLGDQGHAVGPDFAGLRGRSPEQLIVDILDPSRAVEPNFLQYSVETKGGETITGVIASETATSVTLRGADAKETTVLRGQIEKLTASKLSLMPEGLEKGLAAQDFADLLAIFAAPRNAEIIKPNGDGSLQLLATNCEIFGSSLVLEEHYQNLGYWQSRDDHAVWLLDVPKRGRFSVALNYACPDENAGNEFVVEFGDQLLSAKTVSTGTWDDYQWRGVGTAELAAGRQQVRMRPKNFLRGAMLDLKSITLTPIVEK